MKPIQQYIDHTNLKADATTEDIRRLCAEARQCAFAAVCVYPDRVALAKALLRDTSVRVACVVGFPSGAAVTRVKAFETQCAVEDGCDEVDMVLNIGALKDGEDARVAEDISAVVNAAQGKPVKVILETCLLTDEEKLRAVKLSCQAGAAFVKTSTGFSKAGATPADVALMKSACTEGVLVKAAGGIRCYEDAKQMIDAGADRIGTSAGVAIVKDAPKAEA